jgi:head-tail adaptor
MSLLSIRELDRQVVIELATVTRHAETGAELTTWADYLTVWGKVTESVGSGTAGQAGAVVDEFGQACEVWVRWFAGFDRLRMRVRVGTRPMRIVGSAVVGRSEFIKLALEEWSHG